MKAATKKTLRSMVGVVEQMRADIEEIVNQEQEVHNNKSEKWQDSDMGQKSADAIGELENAASYIDDVINSLNEAIGGDE
jgi:hypothetical protein